MPTLPSFIALRQGHFLLIFNAQHPFHRLLLVPEQALHGLQASHHSLGFISCLIFLLVSFHISSDFFLRIFWLSGFAEIFKLFVVAILRFLKLTEFSLDHLGI